MKKTQSKRANPRTTNKKFDDLTEAFKNGGATGYDRGYKVGFDDGYANAVSKQLAGIPMWRPAGAHATPGLYIIEGHEGNHIAATFYESSYGDFDKRNEAGFIDFEGNSVKFHCINRFFGPISRFNLMSGENGCGVSAQTARPING